MYSLVCICMCENLNPLYLAFFAFYDFRLCNRSMIALASLVKMLEHIEMKQAATRIQVCQPMLDMVQ